MKLCCVTGAIALLNLDRRQIGCTISMVNEALWCDWSHCTTKLGQEADWMYQVNGEGSSGVLLEADQLFLVMVNPFKQVDDWSPGATFDK